MPLNSTHARQLLAKGDLRSLFIEELGWDRHSATLEVTTQPTTHTLHALAQKRGMVAYHCATPAGQRLPDHAQRRKIEHQVAKSTHEHLIVFTDASNETQIWQWVKREPGKPAACREHPFHRSQPGDALLQKLEAIAFSLEEEARISLTDVTSRARAGFDVEKITKRFYDRFQKEHTSFLKFITGITEIADHEWYASVMLNRLMFVYFIQRKGFLDGDQHYLRNRLKRMRDEHGKNKFYSFYRYFLLRLFHEGLGGRKRSTELETLTGRIPYLNGGLFDVHELELPDRYGKSIQIPDQAFECIFDFFDQYQWHLDERPLRADNEINPDVLGYIFEKYINAIQPGEQKAKGAYYTKEDITEYIGKNTVLPFLFDAARSKCKVAFENPKGPTVWDLLKEDPDRYIYSAVRHGVGELLPNEIAAGLNPPALHNLVGKGPAQTLDLRKGWNKPAPATHALPTETWREVIARRKRYEDIRNMLAQGEVRDINGILTLNLDIRQLAEDVIGNSEGPELLRACWHAIEKVTILDPTCGSGAFLFAALNILEPLYEACLDRMESFVADLDRSNEKHRPEKFSDFRKILGHVAAHPNRRYFIFKSIILNNLYGVDIMEEAVEICKLRLFLKLAAQVEPDAARDNLGIEPLPDIDFNIRAGNTLVGYASYDEVKHAVTSTLDFDNAMEKIAIKAADLQQTFDKFRQVQTEGDGSVPAADKRKLQRRLKALEDELNRHLAGKYGVKGNDKVAYAKWVKSHQPFHWFIQFYGILNAGGFDVTIGNPPYVEYKDVKDSYKVYGFQTLACGDLYAFTMERAYSLLQRGGRIGLIVPVSIFCVDGFKTLQTLSLQKLESIWASSYANRPAQLFDGAQKRLTIVIGKRGESTMPAAHTTTYYRWHREEFPSLFRARVYYAPIHSNFSIFPASLEKLGSTLEVSAFSKLVRMSDRLETAVTSVSKHRVFYTRKFGYFLAFLDFVPRVTEIRTRKQVAPSELKDLSFPNTATVLTTVACLSSSTFFWFWNVLSDCRNLNRRDILSFPLNPISLTQQERRRLADLGEKYLKALRGASCEMQKSGLMLQTFEYSSTKPILDEIDTVLAGHYGFTEEELDFIINYDIKYRMGRDAEGEDE